MKKMNNIFSCGQYNNMVTIVSIAVTVLSVIQSFRSNCRAKREHKKREDAERALNSITWDDMRNASEKIAKKLIKTYQPAVIYIPNIKSGIMLQFIRNYFKEYIPVIVGQAVSKEYFLKDANSKIRGIDNYWYVNTKKWHTYIPNILLEYKEQNILILDNLSLTGNFFSIITDKLVEEGIPRNHIATACIATTEAAIADNTAPQYYYKILANSKTVYMPWGH
ncbi:MAG: hypothetical protein NC318_12900 [Blautia sp.]|nr:hypothetical protein [Blautia sp.]